MVHPHQSVFSPTQKLVYLGFVFDSVSMCVTLTPEKAAKLKKAATDLPQSKKPIIRKVAQCLGYIVSSFPGSAYDPLHYLSLEYDKTTALKFSKGDFDATMEILYRPKLQTNFYSGLTQFRPLTTQ